MAATEKEEQAYVFAMHLSVFSSYRDREGLGRLFE
jgi:hypothetical protein